MFEFTLTKQQEKMVFFAESLDQLEDKVNDFAAKKEVDVQLVLAIRPDGFLYSAVVFYVENKI